MQAVSRQWRVWGDLLVAAAVTVVGQQETWAPVAGFAHRATPLWAMGTAYAIAAMALLWRRYQPLLVVAVVNLALGSLFVLASAPDGLGDLLPVVIAFYSACRHAPAKQVIVAAAVTAAGIALHEANDPHFAFDGRAATVWLVVAAGGCVAWAIRARAGDAAAERKRADLVERLRDEQAALAVRAERDRLSRELHDLVGHGMSLAVLQVVAAQTTLDAGDVEAARARLSQLERTTRETLDEMRRLVAVSSDGSAPLAPQPSVADLPRLVDDVRAAGGDVTLDVDVNATLPPGVSLTAYRVVQEALTNVIRHAHAPAHVQVSAREHRLVVEVADEGAAGPVDFTGGRGVIGMRARIALYGGTLDMSRCEPRGVRVLATIPLDVEAR